MPKKINYQIRDDYNMGAFDRAFRSSEMNFLCMLCGKEASISSSESAHGHNLCHTACIDKLIKNTAYGKTNASDINDWFVNRYINVDTPIWKNDDFTTWKNICMEVTE